MPQEPDAEAIFNPLGLSSDATLTPAEARELAVRFGEAHGRSMRALQELGDRYGGGLIGTLRGLVDLTARRGVITSGDADRLRRLADLLDADALDLGAIRRLRSDAVGDPGASPAAIATLGVAVDTFAVAAAATATDDKTAAALGGAADVVGTLAGMGVGGSFGGIVGSVAGGIAGGVAASVAAHHVAS